MTKLLEKGDTVGEIGLVYNKNTMARAIALEDTHIVYLNKLSEDDLFDTEK